MVYLDYNATTPVDPRVAPRLHQWETDVWGNPSSVHARGQEALRLVDEARTQVAGLVGVKAQDVVFTSGASEAANLALLGLGVAARGKRNRDIVIAATEHKAVRQSAELAVDISGGRLRVVGVGADGTVDLEDLGEALQDSAPCAVVVMHANNETGVINPLSKVRDLVSEDVPLVVDLTQSAGKIPLEVPFDIGFLSSHKIYGPKGVGALVADRRAQRLLTPIFAGGGQERGLRGGTVPAPLVAGFGLAAQIADDSMSVDAGHSRSLVLQLLNGLGAAGISYRLNGQESPRIPNTVNLRLPGVDAEALMARTPEVEVSDGSACSSAQPTPSHVLMAMGLSRQEASECIRISVGRPTTSVEIETAVSHLSASIRTVLDLEEGIPA